ETGERARGVAGRAAGRSARCREPGRTRRGGIRNDEQQRGNRHARKEGRREAAHRTFPAPAAGGWGVNRPEGSRVRRSELNRSRAASAAWSSRTRSRSWTSESQSKLVDLLGCRSGMRPTPSIATNNETRASFLILHL